MELVLHTLADLVFQIKRSQLLLMPSHPIQNLGFTINTSNLSLMVARSMIHDLKPEASRLLHRPACSIKALASFIEKAQYMVIALFTSRLKPRHQLLCKNMILH
jgi:hypothetical protein